MSKIMLLVAMLAMVLAAAVPALAQTVTQTGNGNVACVQTAVNQEIDKDQIAISAYGDATNINIQAIAQSCNVTVAQVNAVAVEMAAPVNAAKVAGHHRPHVRGPDVAAAAPTAVQYQYAAPTAGPAAELPRTGGSSLIALGAGAMLVVGGLLTRRVIR